MQIGSYSVECLIDADFALDGGAMFGVVPRALWARTNPPDESNRIDMVARCLLVRGEDRCILVETGLGDKLDAKQTAIFKVRRRDGGLAAALTARGLSPEDITDVVLTHLHFDHAGGTTRHDGDRLALSFPRAVHHLQRRHWDWARKPTSKDAGSFRPEDFSPLAGSRWLRLHDGAVELCEGIRLQPVDGHTAAMQLVHISGPQATLLFCADLLPTTTHLRWPYIMAYDNEPLRTLEEKRRFFIEAADGGWIVVPGHDPACDAARLRREGSVVKLAEPLQL